MSSTETENSLYARLGGAPTVKEAVRLFYDRVLVDHQLMSYFDGADLDRLRGHQARLIGQILGGPATYDGVGLAAGHAGLGITDADYDRVGEHLLAVLDDLGAGAEAAATVAAALGQARASIVSARPAPDADA